MTRLRIIVAATLLVIWLPATSLCLAENAGLIGQGDGCADCPSSQQTAPCCKLASAVYKLDDNRSVVVAESGNLLFGITIDIDLPAGVSVTPNDIESPPEIRSSWQFYFRAAASPRAPSLAS